MRAFLLRFDVKISIYRGRYFLGGRADVNLACHGVGNQRRAALAEFLNATPNLAEQISELGCAFNKHRVDSLLFNEWRERYDELAKHLQRDLPEGDTFGERGEALLRGLRV